VRRIKWQPKAYAKKKKKPFDSSLVEEGITGHPHNSFY
jgi:hypothetical protein